MKRLMFISLLVIPFCKAADPNASWNKAVENIPSWEEEKYLTLTRKGITTLPDNRTLIRLEYLDLQRNPITTFPKRLSC